MISVVMSVYNTPDDWLCQSIQSVLDQSYSDFEFLIVDDCSSQSNKEILVRYKNRDPRIHIIANCNNLGLTRSLNKAIFLAKGDYIARLDSDDMALPNRFQRQLKCFYENPQLVLCGTGTARLMDDREEYYKPLTGSSDYLKINLLFGNIFAHSSVMIRKSVLKANNLQYDERFLFAQDYELWTRLAVYGDVENIDEKLCVYRIHKEQISCKQIESQNDFRDKIVQRNLKGIGLNVPLKSINRCLNIFFAKGNSESCLWIISFTVRIVLALFARYKLTSVEMIKKILWNSVWLLKKSFLRGCNSI